MARDLYHENVRKALENEGWLITHDPYPIKIGAIRMFLDLGAERVIAAEKENEQIAIEPGRRCDKVFHWRLNDF